MLKERLKEIMFDQKSVFNGKTGLINRTIPLQKFILTKQVVIISSC